MTVPQTIPISWVIIGMLVIVVVWGQCGKGRLEQEQPKRDTGRTVEYITQSPVSIPQYQPIIIESKQPVTIPAQYQPAQDQTLLLKQYQTLIEKFLSVNSYKDSITLKDSSGADVGKVLLNDVVSENQILSRSPSYQLRLPVVTNTITITNPAPKVRQVYAGIGLTGSQSQLVQSIDAGLIYKDRRDRIFTGGIGLGLDGKPIARVGTAWKIKLK